MIEILRRLRAEAADDEMYRGAQLDLVIRGAGFLSMLGAIVALALCCAYPPTAQIGWLGWLVVLPVSAVSIVSGSLSFTLRHRPSLRDVRASSFLGVVQIALLQWLAGGGHAPFLQLLLLPALGAAVGEPIWHCMKIALLALLAALSPLLYSHLELLSTITEFALLGVMTVMAAVIITTTRTHRALLKDAREQANLLAHVDQLTGMPNRRAFEEELQRLSESARLSGASLSLLLCDVDRFKRINDSFGHAAGDEVLKAIAAALSAAVRKPDEAFRWAGDEFAVLLPATDAEGAGRVATRLRKAVAAGCERPDGQPLAVCVGVAELDAETSAEQMLIEADRDLFEQKAKRDGHDEHQRSTRAWAEIRAAAPGRRIRSRPSSRG